MRPDTVHAMAQLVRHSRGLVTTVEKWIAHTPPEVVQSEIDEVIAFVRDALTQTNNSLGTPRPAAPSPAPVTRGDRPAVPRPPDLQPR